jgi:hypothetical protein
VAAATWLANQGPGHLGSHGADQISGTGVVERAFHHESGHSTLTVGELDQASVGVGNADVAGFVEHRHTVGQQGAVGIR